MASVFDKLPGIIARLEAKAGGVTNYTRHLRKQLADLQAEGKDPTSPPKETTYFSGNGPPQPEPRKDEGE